MITVRAGWVNVKEYVSFVFAEKVTLFYFTHRPNASYGIRFGIAFKIT